MKRTRKISGVYVYDADPVQYESRRFIFVIVENRKDSYDIRYRGDVDKRPHEHPQWAPGWLDFNGDWLRDAKRIA